jgi:short subunit dehydrogenase-like uncharacterized protein
LDAEFLLYGANGFVGEAIARLAVQQGLRPMLAGRDAAKIEKLASELGAAHRVFSLDEPAAMDQALSEVPVVLHCAGPYVYTSKPMVEGCLRSGTHYLDLTGELPVYAAVAASDAEAGERGVMLLPGAGFDVVPTDCLALHLKNRLPSATRLTLAFCWQGPAGAPPGTQRTAIEVAAYGDRVRRNGRLEEPEQPVKTRQIDFGYGPLEAMRVTWGDVFTAYYTTGIANIEDYMVVSRRLRRQWRAAAALRPLLRWSVVRELAKLAVSAGPTRDECAISFTHVWGEAQDEGGLTAVSRLHGPQAGVVWTARAALAAISRVLAGNAPAGFQTPARAYGADFALEAEGVTREDVG